MADPQTENGHVEIANDLWDALVRQKLSGQEWQVLLAIFRKLYGWKKKEDWITNRLLASVTSLRVERVSEAVQRLARRNIIGITEKRKGYRRRIRINKDFDTWVGITENRNITEKRKGYYGKPYEVLRKIVRRTTKETTTKETTKKEKGIPEKKMKFEERKIFDAWNNHPNIKPTHRVFTTAMRKAISARLKNYTVDEICQAIKNYGDSTKEFWAKRRQEGAWTLDLFLSRGEGTKGLGRFLEGPINDGKKEDGYIGGDRGFK